MTNEQHAQTLEEIAARWQTTWPYESAALRAGAAALRAPQGWQPIATAPKGVSMLRVLQKARAERAEAALAATRTAQEP